MAMKSKLKKLVPARFFDVYHLVLAYFAAWRHGFPSEKMIVIGVTGTNGKSTTANLIARILEEAGEKVGLTTTVNFRIAGQDWLNDTKMTMLGRSRLQALLARMVAAGCRYAVVETSSEGVKQHRHAAINYDAVVFTNLTPEHLESHGGFENYKRAKGELFRHLTARPVKRFGGREIVKTSVVNLNDPHAGYFLSFAAPKKIGYRAELPGRSAVAAAVDETTVATDVRVTTEGSAFSVGGAAFLLKLLGAFNVENALAAIAVTSSLGVPLATAARALAKIEVVPGRMEFIAAGQPFAVLVDYAPEPESFRKLYEAVALFPKKRIIHVLGSCGGGRDRDRRPVLGRLAAEHADIVIVTNEDPYDDDPLEIIREVAAGARAAGKRERESLFLVPERHEALRQAVDLAAPGDLVIATGKGAEQAIVGAHGARQPWDERVELRRLIARRLADGK
ncbi:MAG: UDP-N-acetylmuramyl-tripeptide synthetase [Patescibacteria group bacterium]|jgi:UDP-N-acetylmuramoyl-L-alanyl-D-glutamate--2,6-diaminopimelate ligase